MLSKTQRHKNKLICRNSAKLTSLYQLCHQVRFRDNFIPYKYSSPHFANASSDGAH